MESAKLLGHKEDQERFTEVLNKAKESYEIKLWNGKMEKNKISYANSKHLGHMCIRTFWPRSLLFGYENDCMLYKFWNG